MKEFMLPLLNEPKSLELSRNYDGIGNYDDTDCPSMRKLRNYAILVRLEMTGVRVRR